jgi:hypothetical protein
VLDAVANSGCHSVAQFVRDAEILKDVGTIGERSGLVTTVRTLSNAGNIVRGDSGTGTYTVGADCTGTFTITASGLGQLQVDIVVDDQGR